MLPSLWPGDLVTIEAEASAGIQAGDIVFYARDSRFFIHRVQRAGKSLLARGDCMRFDDPSVAACEVLGKVIGVRRLGADLPVPRFTFYRRLLALLLRRAEFLQRVALWGHAKRLRRWQRLPKICSEYSIQ